MSVSNFIMPKGVQLDEESYSSTFGRFIVSPLSTGYGVTIGNAFRRVLLSSLKGVAITSIRIENIYHEFSTIPGVLEDVAEVILNLKEVRFKLINKKLDKVIIDLKGPGNFTALDIQKASVDFEVLNPGKHIATLNKEADFRIELKIGTGRGYVPAEENKQEDQPIGTIPIDSIFTPVTKVNFFVDTIIGAEGTYEKLTLEVNTDGSVIPDDALTHAGRILQEHVQIFINFDIEPEEDEKEEINEEDIRISRELQKSIDELELSVRSYNCLKNANIRTIAELVNMEESEMLKFRNFGKKSLSELSQLLEERGLSFGFDVTKYLKDEKKF
ncbi:DNA-directed RNA polymerase subunit alpha [bacterium]|nr:DNA-directed RNA polymerase subunit alpha [bacterium]